MAYQQQKKTQEKKENSGDQIPFVILPILFPKRLPVPDKINIRSSDVLGKTF